MRRCARQRLPFHVKERMVAKPSNHCAMRLFPDRPLLVDVRAGVWPCQCRLHHASALALAVAIPLVRRRRGRRRSHALPRMDISQRRGCWRFGTVGGQKSTAGSCL